MTSNLPLALKERLVMVIGSVVRRTYYCDRPVESTSSHDQSLERLCVRRIFVRKRVPHAIVVNKIHQPLELSGFVRSWRVA
jgi:hypothetical protein